MGVYYPQAHLNLCVFFAISISKCINHAKWLIHYEILVWLSPPGCLSWTDLHSYTLSGVCFAGYEHGVINLYRLFIIISMLNIALRILQFNFSANENTNKKISKNENIQDERTKAAESIKTCE